MQSSPIACTTFFLEYRNKGFQKYDWVLGFRIGEMKRLRFPARCCTPSPRKLCAVCSASRGSYAPDPTDQACCAVWGSGPGAHHLGLGNFGGQGFRAYLGSPL